MPSTANSGRLILGINTALLTAMTIFVGIGVRLVSSTYSKEQAHDIQITVLQQQQEFMGRTLSVIAYNSARSAAANEAIARAALGKYRTPVDLSAPAIVVDPPLIGP